MTGNDAYTVTTLDPYQCIAVGNRKYASECTEVYLSKLGAAAISDHFKHFVSLEVVWLSGNRLSRIEHLEDCFRIREVYVEDNRLVSLAGLRSFSFLRILLASNNQLRNLEKQLAVLSRFAFLKKLDLFGNPVAEEPDYRLQVIYNVPQVEILDQHSVKTPERLRASEVVPNMDKVSAMKPERPKRGGTEHSKLERSYLKLAHDIQENRRPKAAIDRAVWISISDATVSNDVTSQVNGLIKKNWITNFTGKQALADVFSDPHPGFAKKLVVTKGIATKEFHELGNGGPSDNVYNLSPLFAQSAIDRAIWASTSDPSMLSDVTTSVNSLIAQHKITDFTKSRALADVLGNPHPGYAKKLFLTKGGSMMELREPGDGGPMDNVYDLSPLYKQGLALPVSRTHKENRARWAKKKANLDPARPTTSERSEMQPLIAKRAGKTALTRKEVAVLAEGLAHDGLEGRSLADPSSVFDPPMEVGTAGAVTTHPLEAILQDSTATVPVSEVANWLLTLEWPHSDSELARGRQGIGSNEPRNFGRSKPRNSVSPKTCYSTLQSHHAETARAVLQPLNAHKTRTDIFPQSFLQPRRKVDETPHSKFTMPMKATVGIDDTAGNSKEEAGIAGPRSSASAPADANKKPKSNLKMSMKKRGSMKKNYSLDGALRFDATAGDMAVEEARKFMPPGVAELVKDRVNSQWVVMWKGRGSHSRNWTVRSSGTALREVLQWAWSTAFSVDGTACTVEGLFADDGEPC